MQIMWFPKFLVLLAACVTVFAFPQGGGQHGGAPTQASSDDHAKVARRLVHRSNWASTGTISTEDSIRGFPMVNVILTADSGSDEESTGNIYFYLTSLDYTAKDIKADNKVTMLFTEEQDLSCSKNGNTPMGHKCPRTMISGKVVELEVDSDEYKRAQAAFLSRHPSAAGWVNVHNFFLCKLDISNIFVFAGYRGPSQVNIDEYYKAKLE